MSDDKSKEAIALNRVPLFHSLEYSDLMGLLFFVNSKNIQKDHNLFNKGDQPDGLYILMAGKLRVYIPPSQLTGPTKNLAELSPGAYVGEFGLIDSQPRSASVVAIQDSHVLFLPTDAFLNILNERPQFAKSVTNALCEMVMNQKGLKINSAHGSKLIAEKKVKPTLDNLAKLSEILREHNKNQSTR